MTEIVFDYRTNKTSEQPTGTVPTPNLEQCKASKRAELAAIRWEHETGGITVEGVMIPTDRVTQDIVGRLVQAYDTGALTAPVNFKRGPGMWTPLDADAARQIYAVGAQHVQACFDWERELDDAIGDAQTLAECAAIDLMSGWPQ